MFSRDTAAGPAAVAAESALMSVTVLAWMVPDEQRLRDCRKLVTAAKPFLAGVSAALGWVLDGGPAPLTPTGAVASRAAAEAEYFVAGKVELGESPLGAVIDPATAQGVARTLAWLLGWEREPPIELPRRPVPTADQLFAEAIAAEPWRYELPEEQAIARLAAEREEARLARLAAEADDR
jgi:hypothetical protein